MNQFTIMNRHKISGYHFWNGLIWLLGMCLLWVPCHSQAQSVHITISPEYLEMGRDGNMRITFQNMPGGNVPAEFQRQDMGAFQIIPTGSYSELIINGNRQISYDFLVRPKKPGDWKIPELTFRIGNSTIRSKPVELKIYPAGQAPKLDLPQDKLAFLKVSVPKKRYYIGETIPVKIDIYFDIQQCREPAWPEIEATGFKLEQKQQLGKSNIYINNRMYQIIETMRVAIPLKTGKLVLGPATGSVQIFSSRYGGIFDISGERRDISGEELEIECIPFPETGKPVDFNGAVGSDFEVVYKAGPTTLSLGDPVTVEINIKGTGNISEIQLPPTFNWTNFKTYPPKIDSNMEIESILDDKVKLKGSKNFELAVIPQSPSIKKLPDFKFCYFNNVNERYEEILLSGSELNISPGDFKSDTSSMADLDKQQEMDQEANELSHIDHQLSPIVSVLSMHPKSLNWKFWTVPGLSFLFLISASGFRIIKFTRHKWMQSQNRQHNSLHDHGHRLQELSKSAHSGNAGEFFSCMFRLLQDSIGAKLGFPSSAITSDILQKPTLLHKLPDEDLTTLRRLFELSDQARYGADMARIDLIQSLRDFESIKHKIDSISLK